MKGISLNLIIGTLRDEYFPNFGPRESIIFYRKMILILISVFMSNSDAQVTVISPSFKIV